VAASEVFKESRDGLTSFGSSRQAFSTVGVTAKIGSRSGVALVASDTGFEYYFWVHGGVLRFGSRADFESGTGGAAV
jgi:hypothetical protein